MHLYPRPDMILLNPISYSFSFSFFFFLRLRCRGFGLGLPGDGGEVARGEQRVAVHRGRSLPAPESESTKEQFHEDE
jgi:hypothetical protein